MIRRVVLAVALALSAPAVAQAPAVDPAPILACLTEANRDPEAERACVGVQTLACADALGGSGDAAGLAACGAAEAEAWEGVIGALTDETIGLLRYHAAADADAQEALLRAAQAAWEAFRIADCAQEAGHWGADPMGAAALSECRLNRGATRALELLAKRRMLENP